MNDSYVEVVMNAESAARPMPPHEQMMAALWMVAMMLGIIADQRGTT